MEVSETTQELDITGEVCPMTFVRTKLRLERMAEGEILRVRLRDGEARVNVPRALADHGHADGIIGAPERRNARGGAGGGAHQKIAAVHGFK